MDENKSSTHLNIFLVKNVFNRRNQIIKEDECNEPVEIPISGCGKGILYVKRMPAKPPK